MLNPSHPGPILRDLWMEGQSAAGIARRLGITEARLAAFLDGEIALTPQLALDLERIGWSNAEYWMRLQAAYELARERLRRAAAA